MLTDPGADRGPAHYRPNGSQVLSSVEPSSAPERTCTTLPSAVGVCERSHAHGSRTWTVPNGPSRQPLTIRQFTGPTVTFSRPAASRFRTPTGPRGGHSRSVLKMTVGHCSLGHAHHPHGVGAGAGCALSRSSGGATLPRWLSSNALQSTSSQRPRAQHMRDSRRPLHVTDVTPDRATDRYTDADSKWKRLSHLGPSGSVVDERAAAVQSAAEHRFRGHRDEVT